jgi:hypothetical protein
VGVVLTGDDFLDGGDGDGEAGVSRGATQPSSVFINAVGAFVLNITAANDAHWLKEEERRSPIDEQFQAKMTGSALIDCTSVLCAAPAAHSTTHHRNRNRRAGQSW